MALFIDGVQLSQGYITTKITNVFLPKYEAKIWRRKKN